VKASTESRTVLHLLPSRAMTAGWVKADELSWISRADVGTARGASVYFEGLPIIAAPSLTSLSITSVNRAFSRLRSALPGRADPRSEFRIT